MKKLRITRKRIVFLAVLALLVIAALIYTRPMTVEQICPFTGPDWDNIDQISVYVRDSKYGSGQFHRIYDIFPYPADPRFQTFLSIVKEGTFRRSLINQLPLGSLRSRHKPMLSGGGNFSWKIEFRDSTNRPFYNVSLCNNGGALYLVNGDNTWNSRISPAHEDTGIWIDNITDLIDGG